MLDKCESDNKTAHLWHKCWVKQGMSSNKKMQFYCSSGTYPAIVLLALSFIAKLWSNFIAFLQHKCSNFIALFQHADQRGAMEIAPYLFVLYYKVLKLIKNVCTSSCTSMNVPKILKLMYFEFFFRTELLRRRTV